MQDFDYVSAKSVDEVVALLAKEGEQARILCGGTDLLVQLREGRRKTRLVIDIKQIPEVNEQTFDPDKGLRIGAGVSCFCFCIDPAVRANYPGLVDAVSLIGGTQIQGRATIGGNLCNASPAGDSIPALIVHRAVCEIVGPGGRRSVPVEEFCVSPGRNTLQPGEFLAAVRVPAPQANTGAAYLRFIPRNEMDIAVVGAGASITLSEDGKYFTEGRIALGAVAPTPLLVKDAGDFMAGKLVSAETIQQAALIARDAAKPINDMRGSIEQRRHLSGILTKRALEKAVERANSKG